MSGSCASLRPDGVALSTSVVTGERRGVVVFRTLNDKPRLERKL
ncbi:MAG: hypothetical protein ACPMAQ_02285 [Phycisphaerae bacterium]